MNKIRWGVLSTAKIGREKVIPATQASETGVVTAIASRDLAQRECGGEQFGIEKAYGSYEELLADADVDAVYIPLPNHLHVPWSMRAIEAGKHVLCEKPIGLSVAEAEQLVEAARGAPEAEGDGSVHVSLSSAVADGAANGATTAGSASCARSTPTFRTSTTTRRTSATSSISAAGR